MISSKEIARLAGVSKATVSKVFSGSGEISAETAARVRRIAEEKGYTPVRYLKTSRMSDIKRIAIVVQEIISPHYAQIVASAVDMVQKAGFIPEVCICGFTTEEKKRTYQRIRTEGLTDGILQINCRLDRFGTEIPMVTYLNRSPSAEQPSGDICCVTMREFGLRDILDYLKQNGHRRIGFIGEKLTERKLEYFYILLKENQFSLYEDCIYISEKRFEECGCEAAGCFLSRLRNNAEYFLPSAVVCAYDEIGIGFIRTMSEAGIRVPEDISVVGINNIPIDAYAAVPLTSYDTFSESGLSLGIQALVDRITGKKESLPKQIEITGRLVVRASSGKAPDMPVTYEIVRQRNNEKKQ